ncbi:hypothetical protein E2C01_033709 [Portunus trituberculatus]|uniref:Uncharacterized protein n=1 Tax=Portunus trituberculatus TaxID=210409 RepID=A0A5B7F6D0_PORTR|nr:hypothetical protein [Portunus trituberculatus]
MTERKQDMEELLQVASIYGREWDVRYSDRKCKVMEFNSQIVERPEHIEGKKDLSNYTKRKR